MKIVMISGEVCTRKDCYYYPLSNECSHCRYNYDTAGPSSYLQRQRERAEIDIVTDHIADESIVCKCNECEGAEK